MENIAVLRRIFIVFGIALVITGVLIYLYRASFEKYNENSQLLLHTLKIQEKIEELLGIIKDTESGTRGYVITGDAEFLIPYTNAKMVYEGKLTEFRNLIQDNPTQLVLLDTLGSLIDRKFDLQTFIIHLKETDNLKFGYEKLLIESNLYMDSIRVITHKMKADENRIRYLKDLEVREATNYARTLATIFSITALTIMIISLTSILLEIRSKSKISNLLATVLESSQSGIISYKAKRNNFGEIEDFNFIQVNKVGAEMIGKKHGTLVGQSLLGLFPGNKEEGLFDAYVDVTENNSIFRVEKFYNHDNLHIWLRIVAVKLDDGFTVTFDDITKEKNYEQELKKYILDLKRSNSELEQFAFVASHDLQEPLRKILTFGDRLRIGTQELNDHSKIYIEKMLSAATRMSKLINDLLAFSRLAKTNDSYVKTDLNQILADILSDLELKLQNKKAVVISDHLPIIECVPTQIYQLFFNLIGNGLKFSRENVHPEIKIKCDYFDHTNLLSKGESGNNVKNFVRFTISDNGIGFDNQYANRIFEVFQRLHGKSEFEGTGIGLAVCKRIVTNHQGTITAIGELSVGSTFIIELPVSQKS